ncbi:MAG: vitamin K epoxide reductase family protein, partial [Phycisphaerales bacterium]
MVRILHICGLVILGLVGAFASALLLAEHVGVTTGQGWFQLACGAGAGGGMTDCERVMASSWGRVLGMPSAYWGLVYFLALTLWFVFIGRPARERRYWHLVPMGGTVLGVVGSILFLVVMLMRLEHVCTWCLVVH